MLRTPDIKPYIVYIKPPTFDILKSTRNAAFAMSTFDETNSRGFTVSVYWKKKIIYYLKSYLGWWVQWDIKEFKTNRISLWSLVWWSNCKWWFQVGSGAIIRSWP